jgi:hypothetical protein
LARFCGIIIKQLVTYKNKFMKNNNLEDSRLYAEGREWDPIVNGNDEDELELENDITSEDIALLDATDQDDSTDNEDLENAQLDDTDEDGDELNEKSSASDNSGRDLDVPGSDDDEEDEDIGEEDEENNSYSEADTE